MSTDSLIEKLTTEITDPLVDAIFDLRERCADLIEENRELHEANDILRTERDQLLVQVQLHKYIPVIAEIEPHPDPKYGHCFTWPAEEVDQFIAMHGE